MNCSNGISSGALYVLIFALFVSLCLGWWGMRRIREAVLGQKLLRACGGDLYTALLAIDNVRQESALLLDVVRQNRKPPKRAP